jgi:hypothetical protein
MLISKEEFKKNVKVRYDTDTQELEASIRVSATMPLHYRDVTMQAESLVEDSLIDYLRQKLRELGGAE